MPADPAPVRWKRRGAELVGLIAELPLGLPEVLALGWAGAVIPPGSQAASGIWENSPYFFFFFFAHAAFFKWDEHSWRGLTIAREKHKSAGSLIKRLPLRVSTN